jgi:hypothetical protein
VDKKQQSLLEKKQASIASNLGIDYPSPPWLEYRYPPPNPAVLENIARTLWSVPKFYEQTLHLMNKMNLPPPFGPPNPTLPGMGPITISRPSFGQPIMAQAPVAPGRMFNASAAPTVVSQSKPNEEEEEDILEPAPKRIKVSETASSEPVVGDYGVQTKKGAVSIKIGKISASAPGAAATQPQGTQDTSAVTPSMPATEVTSAAEDRVASAPKLDNPNRKVLTDAEIYVSRLTPERTLPLFSRIESLFLNFHRILSTARNSGDAAIRELFTWRSDSKAVHQKSCQRSQAGRSRVHFWSIF